MNSKISVVIPLYFDRTWNQELEAVIRSFQKQTVRPEIIISHQSMDIDREIEKECGSRKIKYVHSAPDIINGKIIANIGRVRNAGMLLSDGGLLYFSDADILLIDEAYIERLLYIVNSNPENVFIFPKCKRLIEADKGAFCKDYLDNLFCGIKKGNYCFSEYNGGWIEPYHRGEKNTLIGDKPSVIMQDYVKEELSYVITRENQYEQKWLSSFHYGGILCSRKNFIDVGGYCESFYNWGMEDTDIQWKFKETCGVLPLYYVDSIYGIIHLEHETHMKKETYECNLDMFEKRLKMGVRNAIRYDCDNGESMFSLFRKSPQSALKKYKVNV